MTPKDKSQALLTSLKKAAAAAATPGPWSVDPGGYLGTTNPMDTPQGKYRVELGIDYHEACREDVDFIAAANPQVILALLDDHERLIEALESAENAGRCSNCRDCAACGNGGIDRVSRKAHDALTASYARLAEVAK